MLIVIINLVVNALKVFIDPLRKVTSSDEVNSLMDYCETSLQRAHLQGLGMRLGIAAWIEDYRHMQTKKPVNSKPSKPDNSDASVSMEFAPTCTLGLLEVCIMCMYEVYTS